ncbi:hypothetical protein TNIN_338211 [Trichonephila inaurata madagascariensis]|uniref:Uncharacterized protein n=1 Tax=Trichonephila inaurata madagascariensis TaxID=2747483 RepID=A0A8X6XK19_9ARAC|nr:hypothetical protein TNIN_338211 [Trichonephila inaurata madagascariensis]
MDTTWHLPYGYFKPYGLLRFYEPDTWTTFEILLMNWSMVNSTTEQLDSIGQTFEIILLDTSNLRVGLRLTPPLDNINSISLVHELHLKLLFWTPQNL